MTPARPLDAPLFEQVNAFAAATAWLHGPMLAIAEYGPALFAVLLPAAWATARHRGPAAVAAAVWAAAAPVAAVALNQPLALGVHEARPYADLPGVLVLAARSTDPSFPSDHAVLAGAAAAGLLLASRRLGLVALGAALLLAFARVYVGVHYPHDVAAGLLLGAAVAVLGWALLRRPLVRLTTRVADTRFRALVASSADDALVPADRA